MFSRTLPNMLSRTLLIALDEPSLLAWLYAPNYTFKRPDTPDLV
jgi:hypothetical protein